MSLSEAEVLGLEREVRYELVREVVYQVNATPAAYLGRFTPFEVSTGRVPSLLLSPDELDLDANAPVDDYVKLRRLGFEAVRTLQEEDLVEQDKSLTYNKMARFLSQPITKDGVPVEYFTDKTAGHGNSFKSDDWLEGHVCGRNSEGHVIQSDKGGYTTRSIELIRPRVDLSLLHSEPLADFEDVYPLDVDSDSADDAVGSPV